ncbi:MAG TPA: DUF1524 domain-containing protein, partial [Nocardioides sp.]
LGGCAFADGGTATPDAPSAGATPTAATPSAATPTAEIPGAATPTAETPTSSPTATASDVLATLRVRGRAAQTDYHRDLFGAGWVDTDRNGCDTRNDVLRAHLTAVVLEPGTQDCVVASGSLDDPYTGATIAFVRGGSTSVDVDHVVALSNAWVSGAHAWDPAQRVAFANDPLNLLPVDAGQNRQKGDGDAATWLPADRGYRCAYVARQVAVKAKFGLSITPAEHAAVEGILAGCPDEPVPPDSGLPVRSSVGVPGTAPTDAAPTGAASDPGGTATYATCADARVAGVAPLRAGDPGYGAHLDRDGDGTACE